MGAAMSIASTRPPFALADGSVAFAGLLADGDAYVFVDDQVIWLGSNEMISTLFGTEQEMGAAVGGSFVYCPTVDGDEAVWTHNGLLALEGMSAPVLGGMNVTTFHSRPLMVDNGTPYWIAGINGSGGTTTESRVVYRSPTALEADIEIVLAVGDMVGGLLIDAPSGIDTDYDLSPDEAHHIHVLLMDTGSIVNDGHIYLDGALLHQENTPNGTGDNWDNFDLVAINNAGLYVMSGDTNGATDSDEFVAVGGAIAVREGDVVDGITLGTTAFVRMIAVNGLDRVAHAWSYDGGASETVFYGCDSADLQGSSLAVLTTGVDELDFDGDGVGDATVTDLEANTSSRTRSLTDEEVLYLEVDIDDGMTVTEAMVRVPVTCCGNMVVDVDEECDDGNGDDTDDCPGTCTNAVCGDGFVWAGMEDCDDGNMADTDACLTGCILATCGDGFLWAGVEACDDGNMIDTDGCPSTCMPAQCGDGFVWAGREECDDGNDDDTDACLGSCVAATCGDGIVHVGVEECDDANGDDTDACPGTCLDATCGDGFVWEGMEECDDGNDDPTDGCTNGCTVGPVADSSSGGEGPSDSSTTSDVSGTTGEPTTSGSGGVDDTTGPSPVTGSVTSADESGDGSSTGAGPFGGLDDDGGCTCRSSDAPSPKLTLASLLLLALCRRRRGHERDPDGVRRARRVL